VENKLLHALDLLKKCLVVVITGMVAVVLILAVLELGYMLVVDILKPPLLILDISEILDLFGLFMLVLIGIELLETMEIYIREQVIHVEVVFTVALIAVARKVIILDVKKMPADTLFAIGVIIIALSSGFFLIQKSLRKKGAGPPLSVGRGKRPREGGEDSRPAG